MQIDDLTIGQAKALVGYFGSEPRSRPRDFGHAVVILDRGFVYVGNAVSDGEFLTISKARNIRYWGTSEGLAELINAGPTVKTKLDAAHDVIAPMRAVISIHPSEAKVWAR